MEVKDLAGFSQPLTKLFEVVSQGIGKVYEPTHIKRMAKARAMEIKTISSAVENSELPIQYNNGKLTIDTSTKEFLERTKQRWLYLEAKKQKNIDDIVSEAYNNLETEKEVSDESLQEEWINRFFNIAGEISSDDLKTIWSKILSEEIKKPGKCSIRTLESLRNLSKEEAEIFKKIANYVIRYGGICYLPNDELLMKNVDIQYGEILKLDEAALINSSSMLHAVVKFNADNDEKYLFYNKYIVICKKDKIDEVHLQAYTLTEVGRDIFNILNPDLDMKYFEKYLNIIKKDLNISYSEVIRYLPDGRVSYKYPVIEVLKENEQ